MKEADSTHYPIPDLVSIIVPVYNCEKYLCICLESIVNQSYGNFEIILIDDGSTDGSGKICDTYALKDGRVKAIHTRNNGPAAARNIGIENSKGEFIFFVDADDFIEKNTLSLLIESYHRHRADIVVGDFRKIMNGPSKSGHGDVFLESRLLRKQDIIDYVRSYLKKPNRFPLFVYSWGRLFKTTIIKNNNIFFDTDLRTFEDVAFNFDYLNYTNEIFFLKEVLYNHLVHDNYASASMIMFNEPKNLFGYRKALANANAFLCSCQAGDRFRREIGHANISYGIIQLVRTCGQLNDSNKEKIAQFIREFVSDSEIKQNLQFYVPTKGDSRIIPILMRLKLVWLIMLVCWYKAFKRYRKGVMVSDFYRTFIKPRRHRED
ncbi:glycosyltransferase family 2 protein [Thermodesulfobacteriota bacterium]